MEGGSVGSLEGDVVGTEEGLRDDNDDDDDGL